MDPPIWRACAGVGARKIPSVGTVVYYFVQGHAEQSSCHLNLSSIAATKPFALCRVVAVHLLANVDTDEVFYKIQLDPISSADQIEGFVIAGDFPSEEAVSFSKVLTPSDANNGGGFSVPRFCADSIFPALDFNAEPPWQNLLVIDVHGVSWEFRHIYRGTPRRHLLTTGWSRFVNSKKLVAGDSVVFIKSSDERLHVGIRRTGRSCGNIDYLKLDENLKNGFSRSVKGRVPADSIVKAIRLMEMGERFEVLYYPRAGFSEFVVEKEVVERALRMHWKEGMRVKMSVETEDSSRLTYFQGTIRCNDIKDSDPWLLSPWRMLQVTWDEPEVLPNVRAVNPWQVELVLNSLHLQAPHFPAMKKLKSSQHLELSSEIHNSILFHPSLTNNIKMVNLNPHVSFSTIPAGMQGARHELCVPSYSSLVHINTNHMLIDNLHGINMPEELNTSKMQAPSPTRERVHDHTLELLGVAACKPTKDISKVSIQLFGQIITTQANGDPADKENKENGGVRSHGFSRSFPQQAVA